MEDNIFDIEFEAEGKLYKGWVHPSIKLTPEGKPVSFHVVINHTSFGYLSYKNPRWHVNEDRPPELVQIIGEQIEKHYTNIK
jgi:hypothetical protein